MSSLAQGPGYYLSLTSINYYTEGGEPLPMWAGTVAQELGLTGIAEKEHVERLCAGFHHEDGKRLVRNAGTDTRNPGHDCTFSAPKSVSVAWAMADPELRARMQKAQDTAVRQALTYLEDKAGFARVGAQGQQLVKCPLLFALFEHGTSRAKDPQLHTHALLINLTVHAAGPNGKPRTTAVDSTYLYHHKMAAGAIYRLALAEEMRSIGFAIDARKIGSSVGFELKGISENLLEEFSKRRAEIEQVLNLRCGGLDTASYKYAELVCKETRRSKDTEVSRAELFEEWQAVGREFGINEAFVKRLLEPARTLSVKETDEIKATAWKAAVESLSVQQSHWNEADLTKAVAEQAMGRIGVKEVRELVANKIRLGQELCSLGAIQTEGQSHKKNQYVDRLETRYSTPEILRIERGMLRDIETIVRGPKNATPAQLTERVIERYLQRGGKLDPEQKTAVEHLTSGPAIRLMTGRAGTGKTTTLKAAVDVWKAEDPRRRIYGCAVAGPAMKRLTKEIGEERINGLTMRQAIYRLEKGWLKLDKTSVFLVDEAGMVCTRDMAALVKHIKESGARLVLVGDAKQLQPIEAGGPYKFLVDVLKCCYLTVIRRQNEEWKRDAVTAMYEGRATDAIYKFIEAGQFSCSKTRDEAIGKIVERWVKDGGVENPEGVFLIASLNAEVKKINGLAQAIRLREGKLSPDEKMYAGGSFYHVGDRVQFQERSHKMAIENSDCATVLSIDVPRNRMTVALDRDDGRIVEINFKEYSRDNLRLGYASTVHKAQGASLPIVHVLLGGPMTDLHMGYVSLSRSIDLTHVFTDEHSVGNPAMSDLLRSLSRERQKTMALDVMLQERKQELRQEIQEMEQPKQERGLRYSMRL